MKRVTILVEFLMNIKNSTVLVLGGWGLVGSAICRELIKKEPKAIHIASLTEQQAKEACDDLRELAPNIELHPIWGNIFVRTEYKDLSRNDIINNSTRRLNVASDIFESTSNDSFHKFFLYKMIQDVKPDIVIDCINTATGFAYQNIYDGSVKVLDKIRMQKSGSEQNDLIDDVEKLLITMYIPQLVCHVQVIYNAMLNVGTKSYLKIGTSGTGGMGLNIPYTHAEEKPSRVLLSKSALAGAQSLLLFLMGRTPEAPYTKEVKPSTAIAWKAIGFGEILKGGKPVPLYDCTPSSADVLNGKLLRNKDESEYSSLNKNLEGVFIDTGENGIFSLGEFTAITTSEQMEYITPEEIARTAIAEVSGAPTGHDIVGALDAAILSPTYRAGFMRSLALGKMKQLLAKHQESGIAYELLGPPRLSKLLYEAHLLKRNFSSLNNIVKCSSKELSTSLEKYILENQLLRAKIISIGIPILLSDGKRLLRGPNVIIPKHPTFNEFDVSDENVNHWAKNGWVDLRIQNMDAWKERIQMLLNQTSNHSENDTSSRVLRDTAFWEPDSELDEGELVGWIFIEEDRGRRIK